jgi:hypothetical protein
LRAHESRGYFKFLKILDNRGVTINDAFLKIVLNLNCFRISLLKLINPY